MPVQPSTFTKRALRGDMSEMGTDTITPNVAGVSMGVMAFQIERHIETLGW